MYEKEEIIKKKILDDMLISINNFEILECDKLKGVFCINDKLRYLNFC